jgi:hypothetical protein
MNFPDQQLFGHVVAPMTMTIVWALLGNAFYLALVLNGWVRADDYVDGHGVVAMVRTIE